MFRIPARTRVLLRVLVISVSAGLLAFLVWRAGPSTLWQILAKLGWGFVVIIALAGLSNLLKTWAWQLTLGEDRNKISFARLVGLRLGAEAAGQLGFLGQTFGDSIRVSEMNAKIPIAQRVASVTLDRGLFVVTALAATVAGILAALPLLPLAHGLRMYATVFAVAAMLFLLATLLTVRRRWPVLSGSILLGGRIPLLKRWVERRCELIRSVEKALFDFHHNTAKAFWGSLLLNLTCQCLAVLEVCLVLWLIGTNISFFGALVIEALTKLVNVIGNMNPGNVGTYEGGTILIGKMLGLSSATGLALGIARRLRSLIWAAVGGVWLFLITKPKKLRDTRSPEGKGAARKGPVGVQSSSALASGEEVAIAIVVPEVVSGQFRSSLARVGSLPILLRTILRAQKAGATQIMVVADPVTRKRVQRTLFFTGRLPEIVQWLHVETGASLASKLRLIASHARSGRVAVLDGNTCYHSSLLQKAIDRKREGAAAFISDDRPVGIYSLPVGMFSDVAEHCATEAKALEEMYAPLAALRCTCVGEVPEHLWQRVGGEEDRRAAERKLDRWLIKPTDGMYAQLNRKVSIPISRQLIKLPITANMVSVFTLGVGAACATYFALGGYWNTLVGALLCLFASILDGCDGEVARLKLLESHFGCWLETICDYLFYLFLFVGMTLGRWKSAGNEMYLVLGGLLLFGAVASFLAIGWERRRLAAGRPEQLLAIWQTHAISQPSNPFMYVSRHMEFMVRRCFFPYALVFFALLNIINVAFVLSAIGANLVWPVALYSCRAFAGARGSTVTTPAAYT